MNQALCWETGVFREGLRGGDIWDDAKSWEGTRHAKSWEKNIPDGEIAIAKIKVTELINGYFSTSNLPSTLGPQPKVTDVNLKKKQSTTWESQLKFYLGKNEKCSLRDSTSDSSEKLLQRSRREGQYIWDFGEGEYMQSGANFSCRFPLGLGSFSTHKKQSSLWRIVVFF